MNNLLKNIPTFLAVFSAIAFLWGVIFNAGYFWLIGSGTSYLTFNDQVNTSISLLPKVFIILFVPVVIYGVVFKWILGKKPLIHLLIALVTSGVMVSSAIFGAAFFWNDAKLLITLISLSLVIIFLLTLFFVHYSKLKIETSNFFCLFSLAFFYALGFNTGIATAYSQLDKIKFEQRIETEKFIFDKIAILRTLQNGVIFVDKQKVKYISNGMVITIGESPNIGDLEPKCLLLNKCIE